MKVPQSDMPDKMLWQRFFDAEMLMQTLLPDAPIEGDGAELGAGYGTFTRAALSSMTGCLHAYEIEADLCETLPQNLNPEQRTRLHVHCRDLLAEGTGQEANSLAVVLAFNFLHFGNPDALLQSLYEVLVPGGRLLIIHWRSDIETPRGPDLNRRPTPETVRRWCRNAGFRLLSSPDIRASCPWHFAIVAEKGPMR